MTPPNIAIMMHAAAVMIPPVSASRTRMARLLSPLCTHSSCIRLIRKIVHRQPEQDHEEQDGQERVDRHHVMQVAS